MSIEVSSKRLKNGEIFGVLDEMFVSTNEWELLHMDYRLSGVVCNGKKDKKLPFFKVQNVSGRKELRDDFLLFLENEKVNPEKSGNQFVLATVLLGRSNGKSRSYFVADGKQVELCAKKYAEQYGGILLVVSHFSEKTESGSAMVEHTHVLYRFPIGVSANPTFEEFLEEEYEED